MTGRCDPPQPRAVVVRGGRVRTALVTLMGACIAFAGILALTMAVAPDQDELAVRLGMGVVGTPLGITITAWGLRRTFLHPELLVVDEKGILDRSTWMSPGFVAWEEVASIRTEREGSSDFLCLDLHDVERSAARLRPWQRRLMVANMDLGHPPVRIQMSALGGAPDCREVLRVSRAFWRRNGGGGTAMRQR